MYSDFLELHTEMRRRSVLLLVCLLCVLWSTRATAEANPVYTALRNARPRGEGIAVRDFVLERDVYRFHFESGAFQILGPVEGRDIGAVFVGQGSFQLSPATEAERRQLALQTGEKSLEVFTDRFDAAVLLFTDDTAAEIRSRGTPGTAPSSAAAVYDSFFSKQRKQLKTNLQIRLLQDALGGPESDRAKGGLFLAYFDGKKIPPAIAIVDPAGLDWFSPDLGGEDSALHVIDDSDGGFWYLSRRKIEIEGKSPGPRPIARATHYQIETAIAKNAEIRGTAILRVETLVPGLLVLPIHILPKLRIQAAAFSLSDDGPWTPAAFIQENEKEDADAAVLFPAPVIPGRSLRLRVSYEGKDVLRNAGDGNFVVGARESWYPNLGVFQDPATFELVYRYPKAYQIVSVGRPIHETTEGAERVSVWKAERPIRVAGFNYGKFKRIDRTDPDSGFEVSVYTNTGTPDVIQELNFMLQARPLQAGLQSVRLDPESLADSAMADGINTARVASAYFGTLPERHVSITQQAQAFFGQSWPSLVYLPYIAALDGTTRRELGLKDAADFVEQVGPHEFAHQWWGHLVGWEGYRDQWLSEGFAEFSASLVLQAAGGVRKFNDYWEKTRRWILEKPRQSSIANDAAGPITQGWRLSTKRNRAAAQAMMYSKGAYVLHMLRMMMREPGPRPDARFIAMMQDFATTYAGKNPSTRDFQRIVEKHMTPAMNAGLDGTMEWFFRQWVRGTEIPRYKEKLEISGTPQEGYRIRGSVAQEDVSADFHALVHLYAEFPKGEIAHLGVISITGSTIAPVDVTVKLPRAPKRALVNAYHDVLSRE